MQLKTRLKRNFLIAFAVTLVSVGVVFATAGAQATTESKIETVSSGQPAAQVETVTSRSIEPEIEPAPRAAAAEPRDPDFAEPKTAKARALAEAMANGERLPPVVPAAKQSPEQVPEQAPTTAAAAQDTADTAAFDVPDDLVLLDSFIATAYYLTGTTATGTYTTVGRTLAVNPGIIPYGTHVWLYLEDGTFVGDYYAEDTGSNMMEHPYVVDIYMGEDSYDACINWGARRVLIYVESE